MWLISSFDTNNPGSFSGNNIFTEFDYKQVEDEYGLKWIEKFVKNQILGLQLILFTKIKDWEADKEIEDTRKKILFFLEQYLSTRLSLYPEFQYEWEELQKANKLLYILILELWKSELDRSTDKYFTETSPTLFPDYRTDRDSWCAAVISWGIIKAGFKWKSWYDKIRAAAFLWESKKYNWHIWIKIWDLIFWWNQDDMIKFKQLDTKKVVGWIPPFKVWNKEAIHKINDDDFDFNSIPDLSLVVYRIEKDDLEYR